MKTKFFQKKITLKKFFLALFLLGLFTTLYSFFIERNWVKINNFQIESSFELKAVLISDLHLGFFGKDEKFLEKVVDKINIQASENGVEVVFIAGDFTKVSTPDVDLETLFAPLSKLSVPVYAVLGNHDEQKPGPKVSDKLKKVLQKNNVKVIEGQKIIFSNKNKKNITLVGLGDNWAHKDNFNFAKDLFSPEKNAENFIILTHNPDTSWSFPKNTNSITLTGHTHGGQIRIPFVYKLVIPSRYGFDYGLVQTAKGQVFTSSGLGEVGLPLRLFNPPEIAVLDFGKK